MDALGIGSDLVDIERIKVLHAKYKERFLELVYTPGERAYCLQQKNPYPSLAARFAAKEAVSKAFGVGIGAQLGWRSIEVIISNGTAPRIQLDEKGRRLLQACGATRVLITLSHTHTLAQAVALVVA